MTVHKDGIGPDNISISILSPKDDEDDVLRKYFYLVVHVEKQSLLFVMF